ncbi:hypothetical protein JCM15519_30390 [Fundidesulfovibrio butyratiphilus]
MTDTRGNLPNDTLLRIIAIQTRIVQLGLDLGGVMAFVAEELLELTEADGAIVELAEDDEVVYRAVSGMAKDLLGLRLKRAASLSGLCIESGKILVCRDSETDPRVDKIACRRVGLRSMVVTPLVHEEAAVGVVKIASAEPNFFTDRHVEILKMTSGLIASAMFHAAKFEIKELYRQATHDMLTGLANRALFYDLLRQHMARARRGSAAMAVLNLDMDGLKDINDRHGHRAGDAAIREMARRIESCVRESDLAARLGGDEFGVILPHVGGREDAAQAAKRCAQAIERPFHFERTSLPLEVSIGLAMYPDDAQDLDALLDEADRSMYAVKKSRKGDKTR